MQFVIRIILFAFLISLIEFYFLNKIKNSIRTLYPVILLHKIWNIAKILLVVLNIYPLFLIVNWGFSEITGSQVFIPQNTFFDFLIIYPFWIFLLSQYKVFFFSYY